MPGHPPPPDVGFFTRYVLENPYPLVIALALIAAVLVWIGLRDGRTKLLKVAAAIGVAAAAVLFTGLSVTTSGEHGERVTRKFVAAVVENDLQSAMGLLSPDASLAISSPQNPGRNIDFIRDRFIDLGRRYPIESNRITSLRGYSERPDRAVVHLACRTAAGGFGPTPSRWILHVQRDDDGQWHIRQITAISIGAQTPSDRLW